LKSKNSQVKGRKKVIQRKIEVKMMEESGGEVFTMTKTMYGRRNGSGRKKAHNGEYLHE